MQIHRSPPCGMVFCILFAALSCSSEQPDAPAGPPLRPPEIQSFGPEAAAVSVGDATRLTAMFDGDSAVIDGIGPVQSGLPIDTPKLSRTTSFILRVARGGQEATAQTTVQASYRNLIRALANAPFAQGEHLAAALPGGGALVMGGNTSREINVPDSTLSQIFDAATEQFTPGPELPLSVQTGFFTSIAPLPGDGFVLAGAGLNAIGVGNSRSVATQVFDPTSGLFTRGGNVLTGNIVHRSAVSLADGGVLLTGGGGPQVLPVDAADRFDGATGQWRRATAMGRVRLGHTATLLRDGRVLVAGGFTCCRAGNVPEFFAGIAEIYDPRTDSFTDTGSLAAARALHAAALLPDGRVLITGGTGDDPSAPPLNAEIYDPASGQFAPAGSLRDARDTHAAVTLTDGRVLVIGGEAPPAVAGRSGVAVSSTEIFDPATGQWGAGPALSPAFFGATVTLLGGGKVLIFGGQDGGGLPASAAALFE